MSLNFGFNVGVRSGHRRHPNTVEAAELLQECIHFFGPLCISSPCWESNHSSSAINTVGYSRTESHEMEGNVSKVLRQGYILHHKIQSRYKINPFCHNATRSFRSVKSSRNIKMLRYKEAIIQTRSTAGTLCKTK